jgi:primosomal protein N' (replication factor Y)
MAIARIALPVAAHTEFDYWAPSGLALGPGSVVRVHLARRAMVGVVLSLAETSEIDVARLQPVTETIGELPPLPADLLAVARFIAGYYQEPLGQILAQMLPPLEASESTRHQSPLLAGPLALTAAGREALPARLRRSPRLAALCDQWLAAPGAVLPVAELRALPAHLRAALKVWLRSGWLEPAAKAAAPVAHGPDLNPAQAHAAAAIIAAGGRFAPFLLQGITGSGKTAVYLAAAAAVVAAGAQVLLLVPEINLTPQFERRVLAALPGRRVVTLHSGLTAGLRRRHWLEAATGVADVVLGTRLAGFAPLPRLGLVVVDEEHDPSYKQQEVVRYHGRDVAIWRARLRGVPVVLGSATPALETLLHAQTGRYLRLRLPQRAVAEARLPTLALAPDRGDAVHDGMGEELLAAIGARLARAEQSLVFINRRGYSPSLLCASCGWQAGCPRCSARLVVHRDAGDLRCHHCGHRERLARSCPQCGNVDLLPVGHGTQRLERALAERFPTARIARVDRDSTRRRGAFAAIREQVHAGDIDLMVGTQMLAKGHDFPRLTLVGVLGADNALYSADFRATERLGALLFQVAGRAGRAGLPGEVIVQTNFPAHPLFQALLRHDYDGLAAALMDERRIAGLPPYARLALLTAEAPQRQAVDGFLAAAQQIGLAIRRDEDLPVEVFSPVPSALARRAGQERGQVLVRSDERAALQRFLVRWRESIEALPGRRVRWALDVDPVGFA